MRLTRPLPERLRALAAAPGWLAPRQRRRVSNLVAATLVALGFYLAMLLNPVDQVLWLIQSRLSDRPASGEIVLVTNDQDMADPASPGRRLELAAALETLEAKGASRIFLDVALDRPSDPAADAVLARAIDKLAPRLTLVDIYGYGLGDEPSLRRTIPELAGSTPRVLDPREANYLDLKWSERWTRDVANTRHATLAAALANTPPGDGAFQIDYTVAIKSIPRIPMHAVGAAPARLFAGKTIVIANALSAPGNAAAIPGQSSVPAAYVPIFAAESLKSGRIGSIGGLGMIALMAGGLLTLILASARTSTRHAGYAAVVAVILAALAAGNFAGVRLELAYAIAVFAIYVLFRWRARMQQTAAMFDPETGLPTLRALDDWLLRNASAGGHVVMARIHGYEHVLRTLHSTEHSAYALRLSDRLRAVDRDLSIYATGHYFGWHSPTDDVDALVEHLTGLRAIFAAPVQVGPHTVDVGITFGIARLDGDPAGRRAAATAAVDETDEAIDPVRVASSGSEIDMLWDISLRARIDEAMEAGEIYCVYQPKIDTDAGRMIGVEALVRWHDPAKGFIPPMHFVQQCEKAGRMEHLTRYVLQSACSAGKLLHFRGQSITMSVNISATLLVDMRICGIVRNVLQATGFDPRFLMLEVTETARITHFPVAATVLQELKALGCKISMDDFGVGAANYETLFELPFDEIKLDRLFVSNAVEDPKARAIVASVVAMGREARIAVVAEGAETESDIAMLTEMGCHHVQGFALSRPLSLSNLLDFKVIREPEELKNIV